MLSVTCVCSDDVTKSVILTLIFLNVICVDSCLQCAVITQSIFSQILVIDVPHLTSKGKVWVIFFFQILFFFCSASVTAMLYASSCHIRLRCNGIRLFSWEYTLKTDVKLTPLATPFGKFFSTRNTFINIHCVDRSLILKNWAQMLLHGFHLLLCPFIS